MIPSDLAARLRVFLESTVQPLSGIPNVPEELPRFETGQRFTAQIQSPLPDGTFRALVAGRTLTLALPDSAKSGDVLELVVTGNEDDSNTITARFADTAAPMSASLPRPTLSQTGQFISQLLTGRYGEPEPVQLGKGAPLLASPPSSASEVAPALQQAVSESGMFFESHQAKWVAGTMPLAQLLPEPQNSVMPESAQGGERATPLRADVPQNVAALAAHEETAGTLQTGANQGPERMRAEMQSAALSAAIEKTTPQEARGNLRIPDALMPIVHQQLEALATHQIVWQGQVWPGQTVQWSIEEPDEDGSRSNDGDASPAPWKSTLRLSLPRLGGIEAQLVLTPAGVALKLDTDEETTAQRLRDTSQQLADALAGAGVPLTGISVIHHASA